MLGGEQVRHLHRLLEASGEDERAVGAKGGPRDFPARQRGELALRGGGHGVDERPRRGEENRAGHGIVLGLGEKIGGDPLWIGRCVRDHHHLARARDHVDAHVAEHPALGQRHVDIPRPHDLVHPPDGLRSVGKGSHRLGASDPVGFGHPRHSGSGEHGRIERFVGRRRRDEHDLLDAGHARRNRRHHDGRRIGRAPAGHVDGHAIQGPDFLAEPRAQRVRHAPGTRRTLPMKALDPVRGIAKRPHGGRPHSPPLRAPPPSPRARRR